MAIVRRALRVGSVRAVFVVLGFLACPQRVRAQDMEVPATLQVPLFVKVLSFDRQIGARAGSALVVGVAYQSGFRTSGQAKDDILRASTALRQFGDGVTIRFVAIDLDHDDLAGSLARLKVTVLYVAPLRGMDVKDVAAITRTARVTTMTGVARYVEQGLAVGIRLRGDRPQILINLGASRLEGAEFGAELLKLSQVL